MTETKFIKCECHGEGMGIDYDAEDDYYYFSYWSYGLSNKRLSWRDRLRHCWHVLRKGKAFEDEVILNSKKANELCNWIISNEANKSLNE